MKIGIISDTHNSLEFTKRAIKYFNKKKVDKVFHSGDVSTPEFAKIFKSLDMPLVLAFGNCDRHKREMILALGEKAEICDDVCIVKLEDKTIVMLHDINRLTFDLQQKADLIIHGHTHMVENKEFGFTKILNSGECCARRFGRSSVIVYDLETGEVNVENLLENMGNIG